MNVCFLIPRLDAGSGGNAVTCRLFISKALQFLPENNYWAYYNDNKKERFSRVDSPETGQKIIDNIIAENNKQCPPGEKKKKHIQRLMGSFYHHSRLAAPLRMIWRFAMRTHREYIAEREIQRLLNFNPPEEMDVLHSPVQWIYPNPPFHSKIIPYIMNFHDLQHEHFPQFFSESQLNMRRTVWYDSAKVSRFVVAGTKQVKNDIIRFIGIPSERIPVIPFGPLIEGEKLPSEQYCADTKIRLTLPDHFLVYPAVSWEHKNHIRLLQAIELVKMKHHEIRLILTGGRGGCEGKIEKFLKDNELNENVKHLGYVKREDLYAIYKLSEGLVMPSLHEQSSGPIHEAMILGCPVAASKIADLPELLGDNCGLLFDPYDINDIIKCVEFLWENAAECKDMAYRARKRIFDVRSWRSWANSYNELYQICTEERRCKKNSTNM